MGFRIQLVESQGRTFNMSLIDDSMDHGGNYFTILVGKNGTGKSSLLSHICNRIIDYENILQGSQSYRKSASLRRRDKNFKINFIRDGVEQENVSLAMIGDLVASRKCLMPENLIVATITPFDKFPLPASARDEMRTGVRRDSVYRYIGSRNRGGFSSRYSQVSRVIESLILATRKKKVELERLVKVFELLELEPKIHLKYRLRIRPDLRKKIAKSDSLEEIKSIVDAASSWMGLSGSRGHQKEDDHYMIIKEALRSLDDLSDLSSLLEIEVDFRDGFFIRGSMEMFEAVSLLRSVGLVRSSGFSISKNDAFGEGIDISEASSGEQSVFLTFLGIAGEISDDSLILLDEPEISLHPEWQEKFLPLLSETFSGYRGCHFIIATHSPLLLSNIGNLKGAVIKMETAEVVDINAFANRSADYQLATVFGSPGFKNEYLVRELLSILEGINGEGIEGSRNKFERIFTFRHLLDDRDPVARLMDSINSVISDR